MQTMPQNCQKIVKYSSCAYNAFRKPPLFGKHMTGSLQFRCSMTFCSALPTASNKYLSRRMRKEKSEQFIKIVTHNKQYYSASNLIVSSYSLLLCNILSEMLDIKMSQRITFIVHDSVNIFPSPFYRSCSTHTHTHNISSDIIQEKPLLRVILCLNIFIPFLFFFFHLAFCYHDFVVNFLHFPFVFLFHFFLLLLLIFVLLRFM